MPFSKEWINNLWVMDIFLASCSLFIIVRFPCLIKKNTMVHPIIQIKSLIMMKQQCLWGKGDKKPQSTVFYITITAFLLHLSLKKAKTTAPWSWNFSNFCLMGKCSIELQLQIRYYQVYSPQDCTSVFSIVLEYCYFTLLSLFHQLVLGEGSAPD